MAASATYAKLAWEKIQKVGDRIHQSAVIKNTVDMINMYKDTKTFLQSLASTASDLKELQERFQKDLKGAKAFSKLQVEELAELVDFQQAWQDGMNGRHEGFIDLNSWYEAETQRFRDTEGNVNVTSALLNVASDRALLESYQLTYYNLRRTQVGYYVTYNDARVRQLLREAKSYDRQARILQLRLNLYAGVVAPIGNITTTAGHLADQKNWKTATRTPSPYEAGFKDSDKGFMSDKEISDLVRDCHEYISLANKARAEAFRIMNENRRLQMEDPILAAINRENDLTLKLQKIELLRDGKPLE
jgi:uncharacterized protein YecE (DUF72 family)